MEFYPVNKLLLVEKLEEKKKEYAFYVPTETRKTHIVVKLLRAGKDSTFAEHEGSMLLVQSALLEQVTYEDNNFFVISESGVQGILRKNEL